MKIYYLKLKSACSTISLMSKRMINAGCKLRGFSGLLSMAGLSASVVLISSLAIPSFLLAQTDATSSNNVNQTRDYKTLQTGESEFDNVHDEYSIFWRDANDIHEDTVFGERIYNEPSTSTKLEMLRLLSKDTPALTVFIHAVSMGLDIDEMLLAALEYEPDKARGLAGAAISLLPLLDENDTYQYKVYNLDGLERYVDGTQEVRNKGYVDAKNEDKPYSVKEVANNFFEKRSVLVPYPDWVDGQIHFMASAKELNYFQKISKQSRWYRSTKSKLNKPRPIFISLYEHDKSVLVDDPERVSLALKKNPMAQLPVVFVYNRQRERSIDTLGYPANLKGIRDAYVEQRLMLTPTPEWQSGEYHAYVDVNEFDQFFDIPNENDFEPEAWSRLLSEAKRYSVDDTSIVVVMLPSATGIKENRSTTSNSRLLPSSSLIAAWDNPRTEGQYKYVHPKNAPSHSLSSLLKKGMVVNRPDLIAALNAIGVSKVPVSIYYLDDARVKPYLRGPRSLIQAALGLDKPSFVPPSGGVNLPPASPPGIP